MKFQQVYQLPSQMGVIDTYTIITCDSTIRHHIHPAVYASFLGLCPAAVFGRASCANDIARAGLPIQFYEDSRLTCRHSFYALFLDCESVWVGHCSCLVTCAQRSYGAEISCLCYNTIIMQDQLRFANNNNDNNDNLHIVGRSFAG